MHGGGVTGGCSTNAAGHCNWQQSCKLIASSLVAVLKCYQKLDSTRPDKYVLFHRLCGALNPPPVAQLPIRAADWSRDTCRPKVCAHWSLKTTAKSTPCHADVPWGCRRCRRRQPGYLCSPNVCRGCTELLFAFISHCLDTLLMLFLFGGRSTAALSMAFVPQAFLCLDATRELHRV